MDPRDSLQATAWELGASPSHDGKTARIVVSRKVSRDRLHCSTPCPTVACSTRKPRPPPRTDLGCTLQGGRRPLGGGARPTERQRLPPLLGESPWPCLLRLLLRRLSRVRLCATPWTAAYQAPPSMGFSRQEYWSEMPLPSPWSAAFSQAGPLPSTRLSLLPVLLC